MTPVKIVVFTVAILTLLLGGVMRADAAEFYVDPVNGSNAGDGSSQQPWQSLQAVWEAGRIETRDWNELPYDDTRTLVAKNAGGAVGPGDTIWLRDGYYGDLEMSGAYNAAPITLAAAPGATPKFGSIHLKSVSGWVLRGLSVSPSYGPSYEKKTLVSIKGHGYSGPSSEVTVQDCHLFSVADISQWSAQDWVQKACTGIQAPAADITVRDNQIDNVGFGISMSGPRAHVVGNEVTNFSGDGMRGLGDDSVFEYNRVANCYDVDENHDDGFQSWSTGPDGPGSGEVRGMVLRGNTIINYEDPDQPLRGTLQGIGCFDGMYVDWVVENNVVITDHWHGITLMGARDSRIVNNTVVDLNDERPGPPWIGVSPHKNGTASQDVVVRNNLTTSFNIDDGQPTVTKDHNLVVDDLSALFVDPAGRDLHLLETAAAIDSGADDMAPRLDADKVARPQGDGVDLGAYEFHVGPVEPGDTGVEADASGVEDAGHRADAGQPTDAGRSDVVGENPDVVGQDTGNRPGDAPLSDAQPPDAGEAADGGCNCRSAGPPAAAPWWMAAVVGVAAVGRWRPRR